MADTVIDTLFRKDYLHEHLQTTGHKTPPLFSDHSKTLSIKKVKRHSDSLQEKGRRGQEHL